MIPISQHQDTVGCFTRTVRDTAYVLDSIHGMDARDEYTAAQQGHVPVDGYIQSNQNNQVLAGAKFGLPWESFWTFVSEEVRTQLLKLVNLMESVGATIINGTEIPSYESTINPNGWDW